jgi:hypothetical protein
MKYRQVKWLWYSAIASLAIGFVFVLNSSSAGWFLIFMGIIYFGASTRAGQKVVVSNPRLVRGGLVGLILLLVALAAIVVVAMLTK